jgi:hypothetical protein
MGGACFGQESLRCAVEVDRYVAGQRGRPHSLPDQIGDLATAAGE